MYREKYPDGIMKKVKRDYKKCLMIKTRNYLKKKKLKRASMLEMDTRICLRKRKYQCFFLTQKYKRTFS